ncbi:MAG: hypothetical protein ACI3YC_00250 [Alloprevotella sp.]
MKKKYFSPCIEVIRLHPEGATAINLVSGGDSPNSGNSVYDEGDILSGSRGDKGPWDSSLWSNMKD